MRIQIQTFLSAVAAAKIGTTTYGKITVQPTPEEWAALAPEHRIFLAAHTAEENHSLSVEAPGWPGVAAAVGPDYEKNVAAFKSGHWCKRNAIEHDPRVQEEERAREKRAREERAREKRAEEEQIDRMRSASPLRAYLDHEFSQARQTPAGQAWIEKIWPSVVEEAGELTKATKEPERYLRDNRLYRALLENGAVTAARAKIEEEHQRAKAIRDALVTREEEEAKAWCQKNVPGEIFDYADQRGFCFQEIMIAKISEKMAEIGKVDRYREDSPSWDELAPKRIKRPSIETVEACRRVEEEVKKLGLPTIFHGEKIPETHLLVVGPVKPNQESRAIMVELCFPDTKSFYWLIR